MVRAKSPQVGYRVKLVTMSAISPVKALTKVHVSNFEGMAGLEDFACATLPTNPLIFKAKLKFFCHPTPPKNQI